MTLVSSSTGLFSFLLLLDLQVLTVYDEVDDTKLKNAFPVGGAEGFFTVSGCGDVSALT